VETSSSALAQIHGATPVDHQVELDEAEFDALMKKLDAMTDRLRARDVMKKFTCRPRGMPATTARETTAPAMTPKGPTAPTSTAAPPSPAARPPSAAPSSPAASTASTATPTPTRMNRLQHALHASARALSGYTVAPAQIQSEMTAARTGQADCLFYAMGTCKAKLSKCDRLHRRVLIKSAALSGAGVCKFFLSETGCQNSASCTFRHFALAP